MLLITHYLTIKMENVLETPTGQWELCIFKSVATHQEMRKKTDAKIKVPRGFPPINEK